MRLTTLLYASRTLTCETRPSPALNAMHEVLQVFVFAETLPQAVLELVSMDLLPLAAASGASLAEPIDTDRLAKLLAPFGSAVAPEQSSTPPLRSNFSLFAHGAPPCSTEAADLAASA